MTLQIHNTKINLGNNGPTSGGNVHTPQYTIDFALIDGSPELLSSTTSLPAMDGWSAFDLQGFHSQFQSRLGMTIDADLTPYAAMNHHHDHNHVNGEQAQQNEVDETELDAYQERLTDEAILDQIKVRTVRESRLTLDFLCSAGNPSCALSRL
jgi:hypothetical protein